MMTRTMMRIISVGSTFVVFAVLCCRRSLFRRLIGGDNAAGSSVGVGALGGNAEVGVSSADDVSVTARCCYY